MIETLLASIIVGQVISGPNLIQTDYLTETNQVITVLETIQEVPNWNSFNNDYSHHSKRSLYH
jgi:hypothetical protein